MHTPLPRPVHHLLTCAPLLLGVWLPGSAWCDSTSSASSAVSTSVGSASESLGASSHSSSRTTGVAQGPYTVVEVVAVADHPGQLRLHLQAHGPQAHTASVDPMASPLPGTTLWLQIPRETVDREKLATGTVLMALSRPYGVAFAKATTQGGAWTALPPFFLVLDDDRHRELSSQPLGG